MGYSAFCEVSAGLGASLSIPFMGYTIKPNLLRILTLNFQFPLWDTKVIFAGFVISINLTLSIPFMGYADKLLNEILESVYTFNSLYGIRC